MSASSGDFHDLKSPGNLCMDNTRAALDYLENTEPRSIQSQMDTCSKQTRNFIEISLEKPTSSSTQLAQ